MRRLKSTKPRLALRLARARRPARTSGTSTGTVTRTLPVRIPRRTSAALPMTNCPAIVWRPAISLRHPIHRSSSLHLLPGTNRVSVLQELGERRPRALRNGVLKRFRQVRERDVGVNCLHITQELIGQAARGRLQRGNGIEHSREDDRLHHFVGGSLHGPSLCALVDLPSARP